MAEPTPLSLDTSATARASERSRSQSQSQSQSQSSSQAAPPIAALFFVSFDNRKGYTLTWHKEIDDAEVEGVVEFKSLPSGLHNVEEDLVYFTHDRYVGVSAFVNKPDTQAARNARMAAVGVLLRLDYGRMGKAWKHAEALKELARNQVSREANDTAELEAYWERNRLPDDDDSLTQSPVVESPADSMVIKKPDDGSDGYQKTRSMSTGSAFASFNRTLVPHHPALALMSCLELFGPLIFPLYRAALLRKRVLFVGDAPVEFACDLVYNLSIIASLPRVLLSTLSIGNMASLRPRPLFNVGVSDINELSKPKSSTKDDGPDQSWIACTTDDVLATKPDLFDLLVLLPGKDAKNAPRRIYPKMVTSSPELSKVFPKSGLRSTIRDAKRFGHLRSGLRGFPSGEAAADDAEEGPAENTSAISNSPSVISHKSIVEPATWSQVAYSSFVWWASAGDRTSGLNEAEEMDAERDYQLLFGDGEEEGQTKEVALVGYFHRLTTAIFSVIADIVARADGVITGDSNEDDEDEDADNDDTNDILRTSRLNKMPQSSNQAIETDDEENDRQALLMKQGPAEDIELTTEDMANMGLDVWNNSDREFVQQLVSLWWGRNAVVKGGTIECCGVRIV